ncbi:hypothetical protein BV25DRAFT_1920254 [Artomyces pyxidatus]|uniref:Uncharacterized protein n=1 Tax=Artomyces pyxidatus TaxID=48021 RepID=A0ACB8SL31_9AGAM|nr:hypothetical protein BV25DRAFT_1920254 [Artomyces pyxidatus]
MARPFHSSASSPAHPDSLMAWVQSRVNALFESSSDAAFDVAVDAALSPHVHIFVNHVQVTREDIRAHIGAQRKGTSAIQATWENSLEVLDADAKDGFKTGLMGGFLTVARRYEVEGRESDVQRAFVAFNAKVEQDPEVDPDSNADHRRITHIWETTFDTGSMISEEHR